MGLTSKQEDEQERLDEQRSLVIKRRDRLLVKDLPDGKPAQRATNEISDEHAQELTKILEECLSAFGALMVEASQVSVPPRILKGKELNRAIAPFVQMARTKERLTNLLVRIPEGPDRLAVAQLFQKLFGER